MYIICNVNVLGIQQSGVVFGKRDNQNYFSVIFVIFSFFNLIIADTLGCEVAFPHYADKVWHESSRSWVQRIRTFSSASALDTIRDTISHHHVSSSVRRKRVKKKT